MFLSPRQPGVSGGPRTLNSPVRKTALIPLQGVLEVEVEVEVDVGLELPGSEQDEPAAAAATCDGSQCHSVTGRLRRRRVVTVWPCHKKRPARVITCNSQVTADNDAFFLVCFFSNARINSR